MLTLRQYADQFKQTNGMILAVYEMFKGSTTPDPTTAITNYLNTLPAGALVLPFQTDTASLAKFFVAVGPVLEPVAV